MDTGGEKFGRDLQEQIKSRIHDKMKNHERYAGLVPGAITRLISAAE